MITTSSTGAWNRIATAAAPTPSARPSITRRWPSANVPIATSAASNAGPNRPTTPVNRSGSDLPPKSTGPLALSASVPTPDTMTTIHTALMAASEDRSGRPPRRRRSGPPRV